MISNSVLATALVALLITGASFAPSIVRAESHGAVQTNNLFFLGATQWATNEGGSLYRVLSVKKHQNCEQGQMFLVAFGSQGRFGGERVTHQVYVLASSTNETSSPMNIGEVKVQKLAEAFVCKK